MKRREYEKKLEEWEAQGYDVSELRNKWFPTKSRKGSIFKWLAISIVIIALAIVITGWQLSKTQTQAPALTTAPAPKPAPAIAKTVTPAPELASEPEPAPVSAPKQKYVLSGGLSEAVPIYVDDDLIVEVNGEVIYHDDDKALSTIEPIIFAASPDDSVHITAIDVGGDSYLSGLYLHSDGKIYRITEGIPGSKSSELVFFDETFIISSLPEVTLYVISGGTSALIPIVVDDDLTVEVNGRVIYQDDDKTASTLDPIQFAALPGDLVHITAIDVGWGARSLSSLYLNSDGKSYKITDVIKQDSKSGESVFFDVTFKISELVSGVYTAPEPAVTPALIKKER